MTPNEVHFRLDGMLDYGADFFAVSPKHLEAEAKKFSGYYTANGFCLWRKISYKNAFHPYLYAKMAVVEGEGVNIEAYIRPPIGLIIFWLIWMTGMSLAVVLMLVEMFQSGFSDVFFLILFCWAVGFGMYYLSMRFEIPKLEAFISECFPEKLDKEYPKGM